MALPRVLAIMGSGETAPAMSSVHAGLLARLGPAPGPAVMLDTPYGFQENADEIGRRSQHYFEHHVGHHLGIASFRGAGIAGPADCERMCAAVAVATYVFAGPGSPSYALQQWLGTRLPALLAEKLRSGGVVVFASAAAVGLGELAIPVYEIYKVGEAVTWITGLDVLRETGIRAAVIPHYNNAEGGTHDTRYCYMGERRLRMLEEMLPQGCAVLGVDEQTAGIVDLDDRTLTVRGAGGVTWRVAGAETVWPAGTVVSLDELSTGAGPLGDPSPATTGRSVPDGSPAVRAEKLRTGALEALARRDIDAAVTAILAVETAVEDSSRGEPDPAVRGSLRELVVHLGEVARVGATDPRERVAPLVSALLALREAARVERRFSDADALRDALVAAGVEVRDTPGGSTWELVGGTLSR